MKSFVRLFRYILRYKTSLIGSICFGFVASFLNVFNIMAFQPLLKVMLAPEGETITLSSLKEDRSAEESLKMKIPFIRWFKEKIRPYRDMLNDKLDKITLWSVNHKMKTIYIIGLIVAVSGLFRGLATYGSDFLMIKVGMSLMRDLRQQLHDHILRMDLPFFGDLSTGQLMARTSSDITTLNQGITSVMDVGIQSPLTIIMILFLLVYISPELFFYSLLAMPFVAFATAYFGKRVRRVSRKAQEDTADVMDIMQETYEGIRVVKAFGTEDYESQRLKVSNDRAYRSYMKRQAIRKMVSPLMEYLGILAAVAVLMVGAHLIIREKTLKIEDFIIFLVAVSRLYRPIKEFGKIHMQVQMGMAGADRVFEIMDTKATLKEAPDAVPMPRIREGVVFENVGFSYSSKRETALQDINLTIPQGRVFALVGLSGAGKTTFANLLCRFYDPTAGRVLIDGKDLRQFSIKSLRERIAIVTQEIILFNESIKNNIAYGRPDTPFEEVEQAARLAYAHDFIMQLPEGYETQIGQHGSKLSGGQRQRLSIARAILKNPDILVFDEATSSLDSEAEEQIHPAMENLIRGRITLLIAHRLSTVMMANQIIVLENGRIAEHGTHDHLLSTGGHYAKLCRKQGIFLDLTPAPEIT